MFLLDNGFLRHGLISSRQLKYFPIVAIVFLRLAPVIVADHGVLIRICKNRVLAWAAADGRLFTTW